MTKKSNNKKKSTKKEEPKKMTRSELAALRKKEAIAMRKENMTLEDIAQALGVSFSCAQAYCSSVKKVDCRKFRAASEGKINGITQDGKVKDLPWAATITLPKNKRRFLGHFATQ